MLKKHSENLLKLADYLAALPADYKEFDMREFNKHSDEYSWGGPSQRKYGCGTVACAVGHGPVAGIRVYKDGNWHDYSSRVFGVSLRDEDDEPFNYMFGASWRNYDNTPHGAAARIRRYVSLGGKVPAWWAYTLEGQDA